MAKDGKTITYNSKEVREALKFNKALYKDCMTPEVLAWDDASNNRLLASGRGSWIHNPISAYRTIEGSNKELADKIFVSLSPKGPVTRRSFANCRAYGVTKFSKNADSAKAFLEALADNYRDAARASTGYNMPFLKNYAKPPFPIISEDPKLKPLEQDAEYHFTTGYPGPLTPAADEVYQQFVMVDALAQFATDKMDLEQTDQVGRGEDQGHLRQVRLTDLLLPLPSGERAGVRGFFTGQRQSPLPLFFPSSRHTSCSLSSLVIDRERR